MSAGIDPKSDYIFKRLFGSEGHGALLADLLNAVIVFPAGKVVSDVWVNNPFSEIDFAQEKVSILDIRAEDQAHRRFNLEMEYHPTWYFGKRALYYWADVHGSQLQGGENHATLQPSYSVCFLNGTLFPGGQYHHRFELYDRGKGVVLCRDLEIHIVELNKFNVPAEVIKTPMERWCYFLKHGESLDREKLPAALEAPLIRQALEVLYMLNQSEIERQRYLERVRSQREELTREYLRVHGRELALKEGREEGREEGAKDQLAARVNFAQRMLKQAVTPPDELQRQSVEALNALAKQLELEALSRQNGTSP